MSRPEGGGFALAERRPGRLDAVRARIKRIPGLLPAYRTTRRVSMELRMLVRGWVSARRVRGDALGAERFRLQAMRRLPEGASGPGWDLYPPGAVLVPLPGADEEEAGARVRAGLVLNREGLGPRVYDAVRLAGEGELGLVVEEGTVPAGAEERVERLVAAGALAPVHDPAAPDDPAAPPVTRWRAPGSEALVRRALAGEGADTLHYGRERLLGRSRYLYQSIPTTGDPGRRDSARRWDEITGMLSDCGVQVRERLVLDVGCNAGMMLAAALADGADWGLGWDLPEVCEQAGALQSALGYTRLDLTGTQMSPEYALRPTVPEHLAPRLDGCVILYLAIRHHIGFVSDLGTIPWEALVYEGGETESVSRLDEALAPLAEQVAFRVGAAVDFRDGEGLARPLAVLLRD